MKTIAIETDVYDYLLGQAAESGRSVTEVLRGELRLEKQPDLRTVASREPSALDDLLDSAEFRYAKGVVGRFLTVLGWLYLNHKSNFDQVEQLKGRGRLYFAKSARTLEESGRSVNPKEIPGSPFWVITTTPTILKQEMLASVMKLFGYSATDIARVQSEIAA